MTHHEPVDRVGAMKARPAPAPLRRGFALAWLMSRAFTNHNLGAVLAYPVCLLTVGIYLPRRQVYETDDGTGMVIFGRFRIHQELAAAGLVFLVIMGGVWLLGVTFGPWAIILVNAMWLPFFLGLAQLHSGSLSMTPVGPETPRGDRWQVAALAQHPDTRLSALLLTRRLLASLTPGSVVVAAAADDRLQSAYQRFGFTHGNAKRVYKIS